MAVNPPPITTTGIRTCRFATELPFAAPVNCRAIRKSDACRTPRASPFFIGITVGRPAPAHSAMWSKPSSNALSTVIVPPKRTPPNIPNCSRRSSSSRIIFKKFLFQRTVMPYSATPPNPAITRSSSDLGKSSFTSPNCTERHAVAMRRDTGNLRRQGLNFQPVDARDGVPVVHQMMRQRKTLPAPKPTTRTLYPDSSFGTGRAKFKGFQRVSRL